MPFLFNEDDALVRLLDGITVSDGTSPSQADATPPRWGTRTVGVYFDMPDKELRDQFYPLIVLDMIGIREATERTMRGVHYISYNVQMPEGRVNGQYQPLTPPRQGDFYKEEWPTPVDIIYQITTLCRMPQHDRQVMAQLLWERIPFHYGVATTGNDGRVRRLVMQDVRQSDQVEKNKRLYRKIYTVVMSSEIPVTQLVGTPAATSINFGNTIYDQFGLTTNWIGATWGGNYWQNELRAGTWYDGLSINWINNFVDPTITLTNG